MANLAEDWYDDGASFFTTQALNGVSLLPKSCGKNHSKLNTESTNNIGEDTAICLLNECDFSIKNGKIEPNLSSEKNIIDLRIGSDTKSFIAENQNRGENEGTSSLCLPAEENLDDSEAVQLDLVLDLAKWNLPSSVLKVYEKKGISQMFEWQSECLQKGDVLNFRNLVYSAPTSAGKTLVSEILLVKTLTERKTKGIVILPFVSVTREKLYYFQKLLKGTGLRIGGFMGSQTPPGGFKHCDLAICTIERANSLINRLLEEKALKDLGIVVVDELHLLGDPSRGYLLELLLTKLLYMQKREELKVQIIGMSATLPNLKLLSTWLRAELYTTDFRPVPLSECVKIGKIMYNNKLEKVQEIFSPIVVEGDSDDVVFLCLDTVVRGHSVLVFCPTKAWCEKLAGNIAQEFWKLSKPEMREGNDDIATLANNLLSCIDNTRTTESLEHLKNCPAGLDNVLSRTIRYGVAFHHAGLTFDERDIIEGSFRNGAIKVLVATSTLSSGVNLPARRVIIRSPIFGKSVMDSLAYRQMIGRAGRQGLDTEGESILICKESERSAAQKLLNTELPPVTSCLMRGGSDNLASSVKRALLEVVASGICHSPDDLSAYADHTLLATSMKEEGGVPSTLIESCVDFLVKNEFIHQQEDAKQQKGVEELKSVSRLMPTQLGMACLASSMSPDESLIILEDLQKSRRSFNLESDLHLVFQVTPINISNQWPSIDWFNYMKIWESLEPDKQRVGKAVGVDERFIMRALKGLVNSSVSKQARQLGIHYRFYASLALYDLVNEVPLNVVAVKYSCNKGMLQSLQQQASTYAGMVTSFCRRLGWTSLEMLLDQFQDRLNFGIQRDLIDLIQIPSLNASRARILHKAGLETVTEVADANLDDLEVILLNAAAFESEKSDGTEFDHERKERAKLRRIWITGREGLTEREAASLIIEEAKEIVQKQEQTSKNVHVAAEDRNDGTLSQLLQPPSINSCSDMSTSKSKNREKSPTLPSGAMKSPVTENNKNRNNSENPMDSLQVLQISHASSGKTLESSVSTAVNLKADIEKVLDVSTNSSPSLMSGAIITKKDLETPVNSGRRILQCNVSEVSGTRNGSKNKNYSTSNLSSPDMFTTDETSAKDSSSEFTRITRSSARKNVESGTFVAKRDRMSSMSSPSVCIPLKMAKCSSSGKKRSRFFQLKHGASESFTVLKKKPAISSLIPSTKSERELSPEVICGITPIKPNTAQYSPIESESHSSRKLRNTAKSSFIPSDKCLKTNSPVTICGITPMKHNNTNCDSLDPQMCSHALKSIEVADSNKSNGVFLSRKRLSPPCNSTPILRKRSPRIQNNLRGITDLGNEHNRRQITSKKLAKIESQDLFGMDCVIPAPPFKMSITDSGLISSSCHEISTCDLELEVLEMSPEQTKLQTKRPVAKVTKLRRSYSEDIIDKSPFVSNILKKSTSTKLTDFFLEKKISNFSRNMTIVNESNTVRFSSIQDNLVKYSEFTLSVACKKSGCESVALVGPARMKKSSLVDTGFTVTGSNLLICGLAFGWSMDNVTYVDLKGSKDDFENLQSLFKKMTQQSSKIILHDAKNISKLLSQAFNFDLSTLEVYDTKIASWIVDSSMSEVSIFELARLYCKSFTAIKNSIDKLKGISLQGIASDPSITGLNSREKAIIECQVILQSWKSLSTKIRDTRTMKTLKDVEVPSHIVLGKMELCGFGFNLDKALSIEQEVRTKLVSTEGKMQQLSNSNLNIRSFLNSPKESCSKIGITVKEYERLFELYKRKQCFPESAGKYQELLRLVWDWRRINSSLNKTLLPLIRSARQCPDFSDYRIYSTCNPYTTTGRVIVSEPCVQMVPRDFLADDFDDEAISFRSAFVAKQGHVLVSGDYSQLELRILSHFSEDENLLRIFHSKGDVFELLASKWKQKPVHMVSSEERQQAKQICYGIIYGQGVSSLADKLNVTESEASDFIVEFRKAYPRAFEFITNTLEHCKKSGFVETILRRRRYFPNIKSQVVSQRSQAERQVVNTKIQGTAADLVKVAMVRVEEFLRSLPDHDLMKQARLVLDLHDELIYEVPEDIGRIFGLKLRCLMSKSMKLKVELAVNVKLGASWGALTSIT